MWQTKRQPNASYTAVPIIRNGEQRRRDKLFLKTYLNRSRRRSRCRFLRGKKSHFIRATHYKYSQSRVPTPMIGELVKRCVCWFLFFTCKTTGKRRENSAGLRVLLGALLNYL